MQIANNQIIADRNSVTSLFRQAGLAQAIIPASFIIHLSEPCLLKGSGRLFSSTTGMSYHSGGAQIRSRTLPQTEPYINRILMSATKIGYSVPVPAGALRLPFQTDPKICPNNKNMPIRQFSECPLDKYVRFWQIQHACKAWISDFSFFSPNFSLPYVVWHTFSGTNSQYIIYHTSHGKHLRPNPVGGRKPPMLMKQHIN